GVAGISCKHRHKAADVAEGIPVHPNRNAAEDDVPQLPIRAGDGGVNAVVPSRMKPPCAIPGDVKGGGVDWRQYVGIGRYGVNKTVINDIDIQNSIAIKV